ncbi:HU family DNA-binding protein [Psychrobacter raelei]|uniref:HU family DNA-binding protein n=1 Tax=Psychrobacter raelei TaxID=2565531 RepID=A0AAT9PF31_9GAMM|nr:HU family DNA-binding protein [Psychrobacter sp. PraFG1]UNK05822.1 HU family DNA-binding protein [Psychrobacter sp. PraFG1]
MIKQDLINKMADGAGINKKQAHAALQAFEHGVTEALANGDNVQMVGFGTFSTAKRKARPGRNPKTGEPLQIPAKTVVRFKAGKGLDEAVN